MIIKSLMPGFTTLIRVLNSLMLCVNSLLGYLGNFRIKHPDNCGFASRPEYRQDRILDIFPANSRETGNIIPETTWSRTACCANCEHFAATTRMQTTVAFCFRQAHSNHRTRLRCVIGLPYLISGMPHETKKRICFVIKRWRSSGVLCIAVKHEHDQRLQMGRERTGRSRAPGGGKADIRVSQ